MHLAVLLLGCLSLQQIVTAQPRYATGFNVTGEDLNSGIDRLLHENHKDNHGESYNAKDIGVHFNNGRLYPNNDTGFGEGQDHRLQLAQPRGLAKRIHAGRMFIYDDFAIAAAIGGGAAAAAAAAAAVAVGGGLLAVKGLITVVVLKKLIKSGFFVNVKRFFHILGRKWLMRVRHKIEEIIGCHRCSPHNAVELPGNNVVLYLPRGLIALINKTTQTFSFLVCTTQKAIEAAKVYAIFAAINASTYFLRIVMKNFKLNCTKMPAHKRKLVHEIMERLKTSKGKICGITRLESFDRMKVTRDDEVLHVVFPLEMTDLSLYFRSVSILGTGGHIIKGEPMKVTIQRLVGTGLVVFTSGTLPTFVRIHLHVDKVDGFDVRFPEQRRRELDMMQIVDIVSDILAPLIVQEINKKFKTYEKRISAKIRTMLGVQVQTIRDGTMQDTCGNCG